mmetsp:Transcript_103805/g.317916  ORF Transcript_103805/g.317916 Transcript_103805/m.317916 type:complete len:243 (-) Transcript_103805:889-1617(-)
MVPLLMRKKCLAGSPCFTITSPALKLFCSSRRTTRSICSSRKFLNRKMSDKTVLISFILQMSMMGSPKAAKAATYVSRCMRTFPVAIANDDMGMPSRSSAWSPSPMPSVRSMSALAWALKSWLQNTRSPSSRSPPWICEHTAISPSMTTINCGGSPGAAMTSPHSKTPSSAVLMRLCCCSSVRNLKNSRSVGCRGKLWSKSLNAQRRRTSSMRSVSCPNEFLARAKQLTLPFARAPVGWRLP